MVDGSMDRRRMKRCDECESEYFADASAMSQLCPECAHLLYGYPNCEHAFAQGRCASCGWDGSCSDFLRKATGRGAADR